MFAAVHFGIRTPGFFHVPALLLENVSHIEPALEMAAAEFSLGVLFIASTLPRLLDLYFVMGKLRGSLCTGTYSFACGQRSLASLAALRPQDSGLNSFILREG